MVKSILGSWFLSSAIRFIQINSCDHQLIILKSKISKLDNWCFVELVLGIIPTPNWNLTQITWATDLWCFLVLTITGSCNTELALPGGFQACVKIPCSLSYSLWTAWDQYGCRNSITVYSWHHTCFINKRSRCSGKKLQTQLNEQDRILCIN